MLLWRCQHPSQRLRNETRCYFCANPKPLTVFRHSLQTGIHLLERETGACGTEIRHPLLTLKVFVRSGQLLRIIENPCASPTTTTVHWYGLPSRAFD